MNNILDLFSSSILPIAASVGSVAFSIASLILDRRIQKEEVEKKKKAEKKTAKARIALNGKRFRWKKANSNNAKLAVKPLQLNKKDVGIINVSQGKVHGEYLFFLTDKDGHRIDVYSFEEVVAPTNNYKWIMNHIDTLSYEQFSAPKMPGQITLKEIKDKIDAVSLKDNSSAISTQKQ